MTPEIKRQSPLPIFQQIASWMREKIQSGEWENNHKLMSEIDLATELDVSRGTIRKAIESLISEKLLVRIHGKGTYVRNKILLEQKPTWRLAGFSRDLISRGIPYSTLVLKKEVIKPPADVQKMLNLSKIDDIYHMQRLRKVNDQPVLLIENHIVYSYCEGVENTNFEETQFYTTLEDQFNVPFDWADRTYKSITADKKIAKRLNLTEHSPVVFLEELYHDSQNTPIEYTRAWFDAQVFYIKATIQREHEKRELPGLFH